MVVKYWSYTAEVMADGKPLAMLYSIVETTLYCWLIVALSMLVVIERLVSMECFLG